jgi:hypothetical protein
MSSLEWFKKKKNCYFICVIILTFLAVVALVGLSFYAPSVFSSGYEAKASVISAEENKDVIHIKTPSAVKAVYITSYTAGSKKNRDAIVKLIEDTELNSLVIDIKDYTGKVAFKVSDPYLQKIGSVQEKIPDIKEFIKELHSKGIYIIGRIAVFQDPFWVKIRPDLAVKKESDKNVVWKDYKGISWMDAGAPEFWNYIIFLSKEAYRMGFDELNFDYIRFPSDGNMNDIYYPWSDRRNKAEVIRQFFSYLSHSLKSAGMALSADLFGMTTTNKDDLNIGQVLENTLPYFDFVSPMVYPSHYPPTFMGFQNPSNYPYEVVKYSLDKAYERASTTPQKIRPWLQDFNYGAVYTAEMVKLEKKAVYDAGLTSWMMWSPSNRYTAGALLPEATNLSTTSTDSTPSTSSGQASSVQASSPQAGGRRSN